MVRGLVTVSALGDAVNLTSRLESMTKYYGLPAIVTDATRGRADGMDFLDVDMIRADGKIRHDPSLSGLPCDRRRAPDAYAWSGTRGLV